MRSTTLQLMTFSFEIIYHPKILSEVLNFEIQIFELLGRIVGPISISNSFQSLLGQILAFSILSPLQFFYY